MANPRRRPPARPWILAGTLLAISGAAGSIACRESAGTSGPQPTTLRIGHGQAPQQSPQDGIRQVAQNLSLESLFSFAGEDGRPRPQLARDWTVAPDWRSVTIHLRPGVKFHDGSPLVAATVADILRRSLATAMGPAREDVGPIEAVSDTDLVVRFNTPSPFLLDALEATIEKPDQPGVGTGPYKTASADSVTLAANRDYYLGAPTIEQVVISTYPNVRAAWADLLRDRIDMLYEVGVDAIDSLSGSNRVSLFTFNRRYQHLIVLNPRNSIRSAQVREGLNLAIDRDALIRVAIGGHGVPSSGPVWPRHWTFGADVPRLQFDPTKAAALLRGSGVRFTCLVSSEPLYERMALEVKRQLASVGVEMNLEQVSWDQMLQAMRDRDFDAALIDFIGGPTLFRPYLTWHSNTPRNPSGLATAARDAALDRIRHASNEPEYRAAVAGYQRETLNDPPAIFLAWSQRARAVTNRFIVPVEPSRPDVLATLRNWRPADDDRRARRN